MSEEKTVVKGLSFIGGTLDANTVQVDVKNGRILRIRPLHYDWKYDPKTFNPWKIEARGKTFEPTLHSLIPPFTLGYKNRVYSPNRVQYPLKRVDWNPSGERNPQNRGTSKYVRISWDEALDIIVKEIKRVQKQYGPTTILTQNDGHAESKVIHAAHGCNRKLLSFMGGCTLQTRNPDSWEGWYWGAKHVWGFEPVGKQGHCINNIPDIAEHGDMLLFWGSDPETTPWGWNGQIVSRLCYWFTELGIKQVYVCPDVNYGTAVHADKWIPIRPNTDAALQLSIAYVWIKEGTYDKKYIKTHSVGFEQFEDYVTGKEDGVPKTPDWAAEKTGIPVWTIKALAREWAKKATSTVHSNGGPYVRGIYSTEPARLEVILLGMQSLGKPGAHQLSTHEWGVFGRSGKDNNGMIGDETCPLPVPMVWPDVSAVTGARPWMDVGSDPVIPKTLIADAILHSPISWYGTTLCSEPVENQFKKYTYPAEGCSEIHMIWTDSPSWTTCWNDSNTYTQALRDKKIEFILAQHPWLENDCLFADIILPSTTKLETEDIGVDFLTGEYRTVFIDGKAIEPIGESKSEYEIVAAIAEKLGLLKEFTGGETIPQKIKRGFEHSGVQSLVSWKEFKEKGYYVIPTKPGWEKMKVGMRSFYEDPEHNPLPTPSGKLEFYSQRLAEKFPGDIERPPLPHWIEKGKSHDERVSSSRAKKYPLLVVSNHPRWKVHSQHDDMQWLREIGTCKVKGPDGYLYQPVWIHPTDAEKRGIKNGDVVNCFNERGNVLVGAYITERIMPGSVYVDHGASYDPIVPGDLDRGGAINTITPHNITSKNVAGMVVSGFLAEVERVNLDDVRNKYPEAFNRPYKPSSGLLQKRVLKT
jgi:molybdopterin guanine dinucleotide-containing S/N-oxide reductase-like protein